MLPASLNKIGDYGRLVIQCYTKRYKNAILVSGHFPHLKQEDTKPLIYPRFYCSCQIYYLPAYP